MNEQNCVSTVFYDKKHSSRNTTTPCFVEAKTFTSQLNCFVQIKNAAIWYAPLSKHLKTFMKLIKTSIKTYTCLNEVYSLLNFITVSLFLLFDISSIIKCREHNCIGMLISKSYNLHFIVYLQLLETLWIIVKFNVHGRDLDV